MKFKTKKLFFGALLLFVMLFSITAFASKTQAASAGMYVKKVGSDYYLYYRSTNKAAAGRTGIREMPAGSGNYYFFKDKTGKIYTNCIIKKGTATYRVKSNGVMARGWFSTYIKDKEGSSVRVKYYFHPTNLKMYTGWKKINNRYYYFNPSKTLAQMMQAGKIHYFASTTNLQGLMATGWIGNNNYYLRPSDGVRLTGLNKINGRYYYFNTSTGRKMTGLITIGGKQYYFNSSGVRTTGLVTYGGSKYYFDPTTAVMTTGWKTVSGSTYYFRGSGSAKGRAVTGWMQLNGNKYYFNSDGVMQKGWLTVGSKRYYMNTSTGAMTTGTATIGGVQYNFGTDGYMIAPTTGAWSIRINQTTCVITVYRGSTPVKAMLCCVGLNGATPDGTRYLVDKLRWHTLGGNGSYVYGQYCSHLGDSPSATWAPYLLHSVPFREGFSTAAQYTFKSEEYRKLGSPASAGCVRISTGDAYWCYKNLPIGTPAYIFHGSAASDPLGKPDLYLPNWTGSYDPTDPLI